MARITLVRGLTAAVLALPLWPQGASADSAAGQPPPCFCRSREGLAPMGARACVPTPLGWRVALCVMEINVMSWRPTEENCAPVSVRPAGAAPA